MVIDDIIKKCIEIPGISMRKDAFSTELLLKTPQGKGSMTFFSLFPGLTISYIFVNSTTWPAPRLCAEDPVVAKGPLLFNYCVTGRCEMILNNQNYVYVTDGKFSLTERFAQKEYVYPRRVYEGMEFFIDIDTIASQCGWLKDVFDIDFRSLADLYCPDGSTYISNIPQEAQKLLEMLWGFLDLPALFAVSQMKIYTLALFSLLLNLKEIPQPQVCTFFTETQVDIAKRVEKIITADFRQHHPAWELAARFCVSETSLKNYFRGVFGQNLSVYLREARMKQAAKLLVDTRLSVAEIAEQVGYNNQSKFAAVFKKEFGFSPLEYRRSKYL